MRVGCSYGVRCIEGWWGAVGEGRRAAGCGGGLLGGVLWGAGGGDGAPPPWGWGAFLQCCRPPYGPPRIAPKILHPIDTSVLQQPVLPALLRRATPRHRAHIGCQLKPHHLIDPLRTKVCPPTKLHHRRKRPLIHINQNTLPHPIPLCLG